MGIPHLRRNLEPYAERAVIEPCNAVVDGPALAYHVLSLCSRETRKTTPFEQPSYDLLGRTAVAWLDKIQKCGLSVSAIYFDSYLPSTKRPERLQRLVKSSQELVKYHSAWSAGVPKGDRHRAGEAQVDLFPHSWPGENKAKPPPPPFLVPAVIGALKDSTTYRHLVKLVPGEADWFCAHHVRHSARWVLTSDSDLLIYDLGQDGGVIFFSDIDVDMERHRLIGLQYRPSNLCRRLSLKPDTGLAYLAFEISKDPYLTFEQAIERSKKGEAVSVSRQEYTDFMEPYLSPEVALNLEGGQAPTLDPRVSEITLRSLSTSGVATRALENRQDTDSELEMFLPFLLDCPSRTSAWEASKPVRKLAYGILQTVRGGVIPLVTEMRRLQSMSSGVRVDIPGPPDIDKTAASLIALLSRIEASVSQPEVVWAVLSIYHEIAMIMDRARGYPLSLEVLMQDARGRLDVCSWDFIHVLAQAQATYYSLRMLQQILQFASHHTGVLSPTLLELTNFLSRVPPLPEFPSPKDFADTLRLVREAGGLACMLTLCADFEDILPHIKSIWQPQETKKNKKRKSMSSAGESQIRARSNNPFDLLSRCEP
ncbi:XPG domain containing-domain-containing protein [Madurella fahalii]|uniref:XPG domain containing-domain-containing protein n=1 Tax=Madurella fahalii TaxID=1157608 RepID=A0ABQ0GM68_9PEZI